MSETKNKNVMLEKFKENKKIMEVKMEQAVKLRDDAAEEFTDSILSLVRECTEDELKVFVTTSDDYIDGMDKMAVISAYAEVHQDVDVIVVGVAKGV